MKKYKQKPKSLSPLYKIWREGKYIDFWNIPHLLAGVLLGFVIIYLRLSFFTGLFIVFLVKLSWEIYEHLNVVKEAIPNKILDILTGLLGFISVYYANNYRPVTFTEFLVIAVLDILLGIWGLYSMKKLNLFIQDKK